MYFSCNVSFSSLPVFLPTILKDMGFETINAQGLTAPPFFLSFLFSIGTTWFSDKVGQRGLTIIFFSLVGAVGYVLLAACTSVAVRYFGVFLAAVGVFPCIANILPWVLSMFFLEQLMEYTNPIKITKAPTAGAEWVLSSSTSSDSVVRSLEPTYSLTAMARATSAASPSARPSCSSTPSLPHLYC